MSMEDASPEARGGRLRRLRQMAGLSINQLADQIGVSRATVSYWENASNSGLSHKGAAKVVQLLTEKYAIKCDIAWLYLGLGGMPIWKATIRPLLADSLLSQDNPLSITNGDSRQHEIQLFQALYNNSVVIPVQHHCMQPVYEFDDWVGGYWMPIKPELIGKSCIVVIDGLMDVRTIKPGSQADTYNLSYITFPPDAPQSFELKDVSLQEAAPIIRVWRN